MGNPDFLRVMCQSLYNQASMKPGTMFKYELARGLSLHVAVEDHMVKLLLSRAAVYPSDAELKTVLKYWPWPVKDVTPERLEHNNRYYLRSKFPCCS